ncbi:MAG: PCRF domain-containing protein, partial [Clostridiales bacterium]|nr:PCRF domain-containing protein [Clostridiales bacterium]
MLDLNEYIIEFRKLKEEFNNLYKYFRLEEKEKELLDIDNKVSENNFWDDNKKAEIILKKQKRLMENISRFKALKEKVKGTEEYLEILKTEFDEEIFKILSKEFKELQNEM